jgi:hypothetical protein
VDIAAEKKVSAEIYKLSLQCVNLFPGPCVAQLLQVLEGAFMKIRSVTIFPILILTAVSTVWCQDQGAQRNALQQKVAELKQSIATNRARLMKYQWLQTTQVTIKGQTKKDEAMSCRYGPDGQVQKTSLGPSPVPQQQVPTKGLRGKIAQKKIGEMKDYTERLKSLISHYAPPNPEMIKAAVDAGNTNLNASNGIVTLTFTNFYKSGDKVDFGFDVATKKLVSYHVNTFLDDPKTDIVTMTNKFASLPDGTNYLAETVLDAQGKQMQITTTNSNYEPVT